MTNLPISVVSANYNNAPYLADYFQSFINSSLHPKELIFVDDGSSDNSLEIAESYFEKISYLKIIKLEKNQGFANALNAGIDQATGDYIFRTDPDDHIDPLFLETQYRILIEKNLDVLGCNLRIFRSSDNRVIGKSNVPTTHEKIHERILSGGHGVLHTSTIIRTEFIRQQKYIQANVPAEDYDIFARILKSGAIFANNPAALINYRVHDKSITSKLPFSTIEKTYKLRDEIFGTKTFPLKPRIYHAHLKLYRKSLFLDPGPHKLFLLTLSSLLQPKKLISKISNLRQG